MLFKKSNLERWRKREPSRTKVFITCMASSGCGFAYRFTAHSHSTLYFNSTLVEHSPQKVSTSGTRQVSRKDRMVPHWSMTGIWSFSRMFRTEPEPRWLFSSLTLSLCFPPSLSIHSGEVQVPCAGFQCHSADVIPGRHHGALPHRPVAPGRPGILLLLHERQSHSGTGRAGRKHNSCVHRRNY